MTVSQRAKATESVATEAGATRVLLLACYELGHQPLSLALPAAMLRRAGLEVTTVDLSVEAFPVNAATDAALVAISVPMHTAMRLGVDAARQVRSLNREAHICYFGLYAWMNAGYLLGRSDAGLDSVGAAPLADSVLAGEFEETLLHLAESVLGGGDPAALDGVTTAEATGDPALVRLSFPLPDRSTLPGLGEYAHYTENGTAMPAGYVEASRGCLHTCRHCPVVPVYGGRFFVVPVETVLADIRQQVDAGARHITFGDPDFLNGPGHSLKIVRRLHQAFPDVTFDFTTKVEHILEQRALFPELAACGASFVVSAFEATSNAVLAHLDKGHTVSDMDEALAVLRGAGLAPQPTWMPFTPWTSLDDYLHLLQWVRSRDLIPHVPAVQLSIRMLVPPGSALLDGAHDEGAPHAPDWLGKLDAENFTYGWEHPDPRMDVLHRRVAEIAESAGEDGDPYAVFTQIEQAAYTFADRKPPEPVQKPAFPVNPPALTEHWFC